MFSGYDPCYSSYAEDYFNKQEMQRAFHEKCQLVASREMACQQVGTLKAVQVFRILSCKKIA